jgi:homospermidine synthase
MNRPFNGQIPFNNRIIVIGFGSIGCALLPMLFEKFAIKPSQITIIDGKNTGKNIAQKYGVSFQEYYLTSENYRDVLAPIVHEGDFLVYLAYNISSADLIRLCDQKGALYIDTSIEPWPEDFIVNELSLSDRTNYMIRERLREKIKGKVRKTAVLTHGANPGLISHFMKQALLNLASENQIQTSMPKNSEEWAHLSQTLGIKAIHIAELDSQVTTAQKKQGEFMNTWSVLGLLDECLQP